MKKPTIVLFDMDGTTVRHIHPRLLGILEKIDDVMFAASHWFYREKPHPDYKLDQVKRPKILVHRVLHSLRTKSVDQIVQPCPGIYSLLELLKSNNIPMGIVSNGLGKGYGYDILNQFDLNEYYAVRIFREDIEHSKPHPDPILRALNQFPYGLTQNDVVWYIGDRYKDVIAALAANDILEAQIIPFAYGIKAAVAFVEKGLPPEQIIVSYTDFSARIYPLFYPAP